MLLAVGVLMVVLGPAVQRRVAGAARRERDSVVTRVVSASPVLIGLVGFVGAYGGYFGASQGVLLTGILGVLSTLSIQSVLAVRTLLVTAVNIVSSAVYLFVAVDSIDWIVVVLILSGSAIGGILGVRLGRRLSPTLLRTFIVVIGVVAILSLLL